MTQVCEEKGFRWSRSEFLVCGACKHRFTRRDAEWVPLFPDGTIRKGGFMGLVTDALVCAECPGCHYKSPDIFTVSCLQQMESLWLPGIK